MPRYKDIDHPSMLARVEKKLDRVLMRQTLILRKLRGRGKQGYSGPRTDYIALGKEIAEYTLMRYRRDDRTWPLVSDVLTSFYQNRRMSKPTFYRAINAVGLERRPDNLKSKVGRYLKRNRLVVPVNLIKEIEGEARAKDYNTEAGFGEDETFDE